MKKYLVCILIISMFVLCSCKTNISTGSDERQVSEISTVETRQSDDENKSTVDNVRERQGTVLCLDKLNSK